MDLEEDSATEDSEADSATQDLVDLENETQKEETIRHISLFKYSPVDEFVLKNIFWFTEVIYLMSTKLP